MGKVIACGDDQLVVRYMGQISCDVREYSAVRGSRHAYAR